MPHQSSSSQLLGTANSGSLSTDQPCRKQHPSLYRTLRLILKRQRCSILKEKPSSSVGNIYRRVVPRSIMFLQLLIRILEKTHYIKTFIFLNNLNLIESHLLESENQEKNFSCGSTIVTSKFTLKNWTHWQMLT